MCDIDHFKSVNDTYGHLAGDDLLRELAALLQSSVRENSTLVRLGGEEFVILAPGTSLDEGKRFAERLRKLVENHRFLICGHEVRITMSIGVAALTGSEDIRDYYNRADRALYAAKEQGRNQVSVEAR
jgi:two-component system cell cycle response regulator